MHGEDDTIPVRISRATYEFFKKDFYNMPVNIQADIRRILHDFENVLIKEKCQTCGQDIIEKKTDIFAELGD